MSLKAIIEIAVHVESFRNIDLFHQGLYQLRFRIYQNTLEEALNLNLKISNLFNSEYLPNHII